MGYKRQCSVFAGGVRGDEVKYRGCAQVKIEGGMHKKLCPLLTSVLNYAPFQLPSFGAKAPVLIGLIP